MKKAIVKCTARNQHESLDRNGEKVTSVKFMFNAPDGSAFEADFGMVTVDPEALDAYTVGSEYELVPVRRGN